MMKWYESNGEDGFQVTKVIVEYSQPGDCYESYDDKQVLRLEAVDNGVAPFIRISTPSGHFSIADLDDLKPIFEDFKEKVNYEEKDSCDQ